MSDPRNRAGIPETGGPDLHSARSGNQEFRRILAARNSAQPDDGDFHGLRGFIDHTQGNRFDCRTGKAAESGANAGPPGARIYSQRNERVHKRDGIRARLLRGFRRGFDSCDIR